MDVQVVKVDDSLDILFGFALICRVDDEDYYDTHGDHIPEEVMLKASAQFMYSARVSLEMHDGEQKGTVVFAFPLTQEIAKSLNITTSKTGLIIGVKINDKDVLAKVKSGEYTGFSIGGRCARDS